MTEQLLERMDALEEHLARVEASTAFVGAAASDELSRFASFGEAFLAATSDPAVAQELSRALADNRLSDNAGLNRPQWLSRIIDFITSARPAISAFGGPAAAPDKGMTMQWPVFDDTSTFAVGKQTAEKVEVATGTLKYKTGNATLETYAGGSDNSLQLLERSEPSFRERLLAYYASQYAKATEAAFLTAIGTNTASTIPAPNVTLPAAATEAQQQAFAERMFKLSAQVEKDTGGPVDLILAGTDLWARFASLAWSTAFGIQNAREASSLAGMTVNYHGLTVRHIPGLQVNELFLCNSQSAEWVEDGPRTIEALNVPQLGRDIAIYGFGVGIVYRAKGILHTGVVL
jgi:hypothetical protein